VNYHSQIIITSKLIFESDAFFLLFHMVTGMYAWGGGGGGFKPPVRIQFFRTEITASIYWTKACKFMAVFLLYHFYDE